MFFSDSCYPNALIESRDVIDVATNRRAVSTFL